MRRRCKRCGDVRMVTMRGLCHVCYAEDIRAEIRADADYQEHLGKVVTRQIISKPLAKFVKYVEHAETWYDRFLEENAHLPRVIDPALGVIIMPGAIAQGHHSGVGHADVEVTMTPNVGPEKTLPTNCDGCPALMDCTIKIKKSSEECQAVLYNFLSEQ